MKAQMKAVMASAVVIVLALAAVSGVTYSWFSDTEQVDINMSTGTLDVDVSDFTVQNSPYIMDENGDYEENWSDVDSTYPNISISDLLPGIQYKITYKVKYTTSIDAQIRDYLEISSENIDSADFGNDAISFTIDDKEGDVVKIIENKFEMDGSNALVQVDAGYVKEYNRTILIKISENYGTGIDNFAKDSRSMRIVIAHEIYQKGMNPGDYIPTVGMIDGEATVSAIKNEVSGHTSGESIPIDAEFVSILNDDKEYTFTAKATSGGNTAVAGQSFDFDLKDENGNAVNFGSGHVLITVTIPGEIQNPTVIYTGNTSGDDPEIISSIINQDSTDITIKFYHFSEYKVFDTHFDSENQLKGVIEWAGDEGITLITSTSDGLAALASIVNAGTSFKGKTIQLDEDVDLNNADWTPIGFGQYTYTEGDEQKTASCIFKGNFDGKNHTISNLKVNKSGQSNVGFFGYTTDGEIKNLVIENADVSGYLNVGVVAGTPYTSKYTNITVTGNVEVSGFSYVGGVGGKNAYADWTDITVDVDEDSFVKADSIDDEVAYRTYVGGVIGFCGEGGHSFKNITSNIDVEGTTCDIGGIVGIAHYGNSFINCHSSGDVKITHAMEIADAEEVGGIAGVWHNQDGTTVTFERCSFTGTLSSNLGDAYFSDNGITGKAYSNTGSGTLIIEMGQLNSEYDLLSFEQSVNDCKQTYLGSTITLECDVDLDGHVWIPVGQTGSTEFKGTFDGQNHTIYNLKVDSSNETGGHYSSGLFGWIESHSQKITIMNLTIDGAEVTGHHNVAVIAGYLEGDSYVINCHVKNAKLINTHHDDNACGDITGTIAGYVASQVTIEDCSAENCTISSGRDAGQLLGASYATPIDCSVNNVTVTSTGDCTGANINESLVGRVL